MTTPHPEVALPPLPEPEEPATREVYSYVGPLPETPDYFTAEQMQAYARAAIRADRAQGAKKSQGDTNG